MNKSQELWWQQAKSDHSVLLLLRREGANPEYPWPQKDPQHTPTSYDFDLWKQLRYSANGRMLLKVIDYAVKNFPVYG